MSRRGQHFLVDKGVLGRIADYAELSPADTVLEIGPGSGNLTEVLSSRSRLVYAIEVDPVLAADLEGRYSNVEVVRGDALKVQLPEYDKVVSNLPYQISSKITLRLLQRPFEVAVLMYQEDFVRRMVAAPGSKAYGRVAAMAACFAKVEVLEKVPRGAFWPQPRVRSALVRLWPRRDIQKADEELFADLTRHIFTMRRKKVRKALAGIGIDDETLSAMDQTLLERRPQDLSMEEVIELVHEIRGYI